MHLISQSEYHLLQEDQVFQSTCIPAKPHLRDKVANEGDVRVELLQTPAHVADHGQHVAAAQQVHHAVQQRLLQLQLEEGGVTQHSWSQRY